MRKAKLLRTGYFGEDGGFGAFHGRVKRFGAGKVIVGINHVPASLCLHAKDLDSSLIFGITDLGVGPFKAETACNE